MPSTRLGQLFANQVAKEDAEFTNNLRQGGAQSFDDYRYRIGYLKGLERSIELMEIAEKQEGE